MNQPGNLLALGQERLALIGKYAEALMQGYLQGHIDETKLSANALQKLIDARILWRPDDQAALVLRPVISELVASLTQDERKRQINSDVAEHLDQIETRVQSLHAARAKGDYAASEHHLQLLTERVQDMSGQFGDAIESLWHRLNTEFGFVSSLDDKIREIQLAQKQLRRLLDGLAIIDFEQLIAWAGSDGTLRKLLVSQLQVRISEHSGSLFEVQKRLELLMVRFRQQQERALLVTRMSAFLRQHPNFQVGDYPNRTQVPGVINQARSISASAFIALDRSRDSYALAELARAVPREPLQSDESEQAQAFDVNQPQLVATEQKKLVRDVENFFIAVIDQGQPQSALQYMADNELQWDAEMWLFQVIAEYEGMAREAKGSFHLHKVTDTANGFSNVQVIRDVHLDIRFFQEAV